jgi:predicted acylesterase/phospholipase RssA
VAGTSYGAVIAALYALGSPAAELERVIRSQDVAELWRQGFDFGLHEGALIRGTRLADWLDRKYFFGATFADARIPLAVACTDLIGGRLVVLREGSIAQAVRASCALPGVFAPVRLDGAVLIDGGMFETVPFKALATLPVKTSVGVHAGVDVSRSRLIMRIRRFNASRQGRALQRRTSGMVPRGPFGQVVKGLAVSLRSYSRSLHAPAGSFLVSVRTDVAWWDFHRSPQAIASGEAAMNELMATHDLKRLAGQPAEAEVEPGADASYTHVRRAGVMIDEEGRPA